MVDQGCRACVMEASSHALHQKRTAACNSKSACSPISPAIIWIITRRWTRTSTPRQFSLKGLPSTGFAILNRDDPAAAQLAQARKRASSRAVHIAARTAWRRSARKRLRTPRDVQRPLGQVRMQTAAHRQAQCDERAAGAGGRPRDGAGSTKPARRLAIVQGSARPA